MGRVRSLASGFCFGFGAGWLWKGSFASITVPDSSLEQRLAAVERRHAAAAQAMSTANEISPEWGTVLETLSLDAQRNRARLDRLRQEILETEERGRSAFDAAIGRLQNWPEMLHQTLAAHPVLQSEPFCVQEPAYPRNAPVSPALDRLQKELDQQKQALALLRPTVEQQQSAAGGLIGVAEDLRRAFPANPGNRGS